LAEIEDGLNRGTVRFIEKVEQRTGKSIKVTRSKKLVRGAQVKPSANTALIECSPASEKHLDYLVVHEGLHLLRIAEEPEEHQLVMDASEEESDKAYRDLYSVAGRFDFIGISRSPKIPPLGDNTLPFDSLSVLQQGRTSQRQDKSAHRAFVQKVVNANALLENLGSGLKSAVLDVWIFRTVAEGHFEGTQFGNHVIDQQRAYYLEAMKAVVLDNKWKPREVNPKWLWMSSSLDYAFHKLTGESILGATRSLSLPFFQDAEVIRTGESLKELYLMYPNDSYREELKTIDCWARWLNIRSWYHWTPIQEQEEASQPTLI